jgi:hypothetical protein
MYANDGVFFASFRSVLSWSRPTSVVSQPVPSITEWK